MLICAGSWAQPFTGSTRLTSDFNEEQPHKLQISDPALASRVQAGGGRLVAEYGAYQLYEVAQIPPELRSDANAAIRDEYNVIWLNAGPLDTTRRAVKLLQRPNGVFEGKRLQLIHFAGPILPVWLESMAGCGVRIISYLPHNAYLVYGDGDSLAALQLLASRVPHIQWTGPYLDDFKIHPQAKPVDSKGRQRPVSADQFAIQLVDDAGANAKTVELLDRLGLAPWARRESVSPYINIIVRLPPGELKQVAAQPDVISIQPYAAPRKLCERQAQIVAGNFQGTTLAGPGYLPWLLSKGFTQALFDASGFLVDVSDSGIDDGTPAPTHFGLHTFGVLANSSRVLYNRLEGTHSPGSTLIGCDGHGTLNAHLIGGYDDSGGFPFADPTGFHYGLGICPFVRLGSSVIFDPDNYTSPNFNNLQSRAYQSGARVSNNSWGSALSGIYNVDSQLFDALVRDAQPSGSSNPSAGNQQMVIVFAAGNDGPLPKSVNSPGTAKNVITVGAGENVQDIGGSDGSGVNDSQADNLDDILSFSSRGPSADQRHKPDLVAPGTHVSGGVVQANMPGATGTADPCYNGSGVSGGVASIFFPPGQQFYTASSGTSHSTPCVSGGCALLRQYFINLFTNPPSPAMTKAYLMNSARYMAGLFANDNLWSDTQGVGEMNLGMALDGTARVLRDQVPADLFTASGQLRAFTGTIDDTNKPFRVTLAWTDAPGSTAGNAYNNDLDLTVTVSGNTYKGNVFIGAFSVAGGNPDPKNNVESVLLPAGVSGPFVVSILAANIDSDGVPGNGQPLDQDFALVIYNGRAGGEPVLSPAGYELIEEGCYPTNGSVDPGEIVTLNLSLQNVGKTNTTNLLATLIPSANVASYAARQDYGVLISGGAAVSRPFTLSTLGACGDSIPVTLQLQDGGTDLGIASFALSLGQTLPFTGFSENFDNVTPPDVPANWNTTVIDGGSGWTTITNPVDSQPNAAFVSDKDLAGLSELTSPPIPISSTSALLTFRNFYETESDTNLLVGYDGGVLEIQIGNDPFLDVLAAGGSFLSGGYNNILEPTTDNPLAGRQAWSGSSGGFLTTSVRLPAAAANNTIHLKWRFGTDSGNFFGGSGWAVDSVLLQDATNNCCSSGAGAPSIISQPETQSVVPGTNVSFHVSANGAMPLGFQWRFNGAPLAGESSSALLLTNVQAAQMGVYSVTVTNASGLTASTNAWLKILAPPVITGIHLGNSNLSITFEALYGLSYNLQYKNALTNTQWLNIAPPVPGFGGVLSLVDPNPALSRRFYRLLAR
jgi:hypothetical protein